MCQIIFHFFRFCYAEMRRKLWSKAPANEGALGQMAKNFKFTLHIWIFLRNQIKFFYNRAKTLYCDATILVFWFFIVYSPKKNGNWILAQGCRLSPMVNILFQLFRVYPCIQDFRNLILEIFKLFKIVKRIFSFASSVLDPLSRIQQYWKFFTSSSDPTVLKTPENEFLTKYNCYFRFGTKNIVVLAEFAEKRNSEFFF